MPTFLPSALLVLAIHFMAGEAPAQSAAPRGVSDSIVSARRAQSESVLAMRRRTVDSMNAMDRAAGRSRRSSRLDDGPFDQFTWVFYGTLLAGMLMGIGAFLLRHRDKPAGARRMWGVAGAVMGLITGALAFVSVFLFFGLLSVGFSMPSEGLMFALTLLATAFGIASMMSFRYRRLR
jgi:hypothetical protein